MFPSLSSLTSSPTEGKKNKSFFARPFSETVWFLFPSPAELTRDFLAMPAMLSFSVDNFAVAHEQLRIHLYLRLYYGGPDLSTRDARYGAPSLCLSLLILRYSRAGNISRRKWFSPASAGKWYYKSVGAACAPVRKGFLTRGCSQPGGCSILQGWHRSMARARRKDSAF